MQTEHNLVRWYADRFESEYKDAREEYYRLTELFVDACWYNFELRCARWRDPWLTTDADSVVELHGQVYNRRWSRGRLMEHGHFPIWYKGSVSRAPPLPMELLRTEMNDAKHYMDMCDTQRTAPYDWAPGGALYDALRRTTLVGHKLPSTQCVYTSKRKFSG